MGGWSHAEAVRKKKAGEAELLMAGGEGGVGSISVRNNKQHILGP